MAAFISMATCHSCNKTSRHAGANRDFMVGLSKGHGTPGNPGKRSTPQSANRVHTPAPKSASKDKTPWSTPRSGTPSTPSSGSSTKSPSKAKAWVVQRLSKLLLREDKPSSKKGSLKDFLSSL